MFRMLLKSKIHRATVTNTNLRYIGSITIDERLMREANILPYEIVQVVNMHTGVRFETYVIKGKKNSGAIELNGGAARLGEKGDELIVISYTFLEEETLNRHKPRIVLVNSKNKIIKRK